MTLLADDNGTSCFVDDNGVTRWVDDNGNELACSARTQRAVYISYIAPPAALAPPLDGLTPTAAWSLSRKLFTADAGAPFFTNTSGQVTLVRDQTGNSRAVGRTAGIQAPAVGTGGPSLRDCADFSTSGQDSFGGPAFISMWTTSTQYTCFSFIVDAYVTDDPTPDNNSPLWYDEFFLISGVYVRATGPTVYYTNHDGVKDAASAILPAAGTPFVVETMHAGGTISVRVNGGSWSSTPSGTTIANGGMVIGSTGGAASDIKFFEGVTFDVVPSSGTQDAIAANFKLWVGA